MRPPPGCSSLRFHDSNLKGSGICAQQQTPVAMQKSSAPLQLNYFSPRLSASCTSGAAMRMHQGALVAALPEPPALASSPLAPARPVELAVLFCFGALAFRCTTRPGFSTRRAARCSSRDPRRENSPRTTKKKTQAGYPCTKVRKGSALTLDGHTPAGTKEGRDSGCVVSQCTPFARRRRRFSSHRIVGKIKGIYF